MERPGLPVPDTAGSSRLQRPHRRAELSLSATGGWLGESLGEEGQEELNQGSSGASASGDTVAEVVVA